MNTRTEAWADYSISRLEDLCRARRYYETYAGRPAKHLLQGAIFSIYLDCIDAGLAEQAHAVVAKWATTPRNAPGPRVPRSVI